MEVQTMVTTSFERAIDCINGRGTTVTLNDCVSLRGGVPSSRTDTEKVLVVLIKESVAAQLNTPLMGSMLAPGAVLDEILKARLFVGISASVAELVIKSVVPAWTV